MSEHTLTGIVAEVRRDDVTSPARTAHIALERDPRLLHANPPTLVADVPLDARPEPGKRWRVAVEIDDGAFKRARLTEEVRPAEPGPDYTIKLYSTGLGWRFELTGSASDIEGRGTTVEGVTLTELLADVAGIVKMDREARHQFAQAQSAAGRFDEAMTALRRYGGRMSRPR